MHDDEFGPAHFLDLGSAGRLAYHWQAPDPTQQDYPGPACPGLIFLGGFRSDMNGSKAIFLHRWAKRVGCAFLRFDYQGHGESCGDFMQGTIGQWARDAERAITSLTQGPQILIGSSMGGWIMLLVALRLAAQDTKRLAGLVGIAAAPDFTEDLMWASYTQIQRTALFDDGVWYEPSPYEEEGLPITRGLIEEGRRHLLLRDPILLDCPIRLLSGLQDEAVPWQTSLRIAEHVTSNDVQITLIKDGDHRLSRDEDLVLLEQVVAELVRRTGRP